MQLIIGAPVQDEIDRLKQDGNSRRSQRARTTNGLFRKMLEQADERPLILRDSNPVVQVSFAPALPVKRPGRDTLDLDRADDRLIDEVLHFDGAAASVYLLSDDTGMRLRAKRHGLSVIAIDPQWRLAPETDERDKEIKSLKAEIVRLRAAQPAIDLVLMSEGPGPIESLSWTLPYYPALTAATRVQLLNDVKARHALATDFGLEPPTPSERDPLAGHAILSALRTWEAPAADAIEKYREAYNDWITAASEHFERLDARLNAAGRIRALRFQLRNIGSVPADAVQLKVTAHAGVRLLVSDREDIPAVIRRRTEHNRQIELDPPPVAPKGQYGAARWARGLQVHLGSPMNLSNPRAIRSFSDLQSPLVSVRSRHEFYREDAPSAEGTSCVFGAEELRHGADPACFNLWLWVPPNIAPARSHLYFRVSARNLPDAFQRRVPLNLAYQTQDTLAVAKHCGIRDRGH